MATIRLEVDGIDRALPRVAVGLQKYCWLQTELGNRDVSFDREYQTRFNGFYRVRRNARWRQTFFEILQNAKSSPHSFEESLHELYANTGRVEASFASKLVATIDPSQPVIDSVVLRNLGIRLPTGEASQRIERIVQLHDRLARAFAEYLITEQGRYLVTRFTTAYPTACLTEVKMLDLVLWQTRVVD